MVSKIRKRDGRIVEFEQKKITDAIHKAFVAVGLKDGKTAKKLSDNVVCILNKRFEKKIPSVENVQDTVIEVLRKKSFEKVADDYEAYRRKKAEIRKLKEMLGIEPEPKLTVNALEVLKKRYLLRDETGKIIETPVQMFRRVANAVAEVDRKYGYDAKKSEEEFFSMMSKLEFLPNSPTLFNAGSGTKFGLSGCYVLPVPDSLEGIFDAIKNMALIEQSGGGVGFDFSKLRPKGDIVRSTKGVASGPVSFMRVFDTATDAIKQGGTRRGALMGILRVDHPDILEFITIKSKEGSLTNFNISVAITDSFMKAVEQNKDYRLINPRTKRAVKKLNARHVWNLIIENAWKSGDPGVIFFDEINRYNPTPEVGKITATNPCVTGDTLVAVADGRNYVPIKQLAEEAKDVPVYCYGNGKVQIRIGKNPRKTRENVPVWKVTLDDGSYIIATEDHKFRDKDNNEIALKDLKPGTRLMPFYKFQYSPTKKRCVYWGINQNNGQRARAEHRMIAEFYLGRKIKKYPEEVVHHKSANGLDNRIDNLEIMNQSEHDSFHQTGEKNVMRGKWWQTLSKRERDIYRKKMSKRVSGEKNGMYGKKQKKETKELISKATKAYFQNPKNREILSRKISQVYQRNPALRERMGKARTKYTFIESTCLICGREIKYKPYRKRSFCSRSCRASFVDRIRNTENVKKAKAKRRECLRKGLYRSGIKFIEEVGRIPNYKEFREFAKQHGHSGDVRSTFGGFTNFKQELSMHNHNVVSVEFYEHEDVYNITVDDFHTVAYITNPNAKTKFSKKPLLSGVITLQCGEVPLLGYESCNLGSINLSKMVKGEKVNWKKLRQTIRTTIHFLDNVIDANVYVLPEIEKMTKANRKIGLGVMGWAEFLIMLGIPYDSRGALEMAKRIMRFISKTGHKKSQELAEERGSFPNFEKSTLRKKHKQLRNATITSIAPTGSISILAGCSSGIEPLFAVSFMRTVLEGERLFEVNPLFERTAKERGFYSGKLLEKIVKTGSIQKIEGIPDDVKRVFKTALDIKPEWHVRMQATFQRYVDNSISKTINMPNSATKNDVKKAFELAYKLKCKGITVYRYGSKPQQVLYVGEPEHLTAEPEYSGGCPTPACTS